MEHKANISTFEQLHGTLRAQSLVQIKKNNKLSANMAVKILITENSRP